MSLMYYVKVLVLFVFLSLLFTVYRLAGMWAGQEVRVRDDGLQGPDTVEGDGVYSGYFYNTTRDAPYPVL
jgi:hypothetical protein